MWFLCLLCYVFLMVVCDLNYFIRTFYTVVSTRLFDRRIGIQDISSMYGICNFRNCDISFSGIRLSRLVRDLDFARYQYYIRAGIYHRSEELGITSLQGSTLTVTSEPVPLFKRYRIDTKLVYWDDRNLFFEHEIITLGDGKVRALLVSRQHMISVGGALPSTARLFRGLKGSEVTPKCPDYIQCWLKSMEISSKILRGSVK